MRPLKFLRRNCKVTNTIEFDYTTESISAYLNTLWLNRWKSSLNDVFPKNLMNSKLAVGKPCPLSRENPYYANRIWSLLMANMTIFNEIKWKLSKCAFLKCSCGDEVNAYHYFFICSKISAFRPNKIVILDIFNDTDSKILKEFITSSKNFKNLTRDIFTSRNSCSLQLKIEPKYKCTNIYSVSPSFCNRMDIEKSQGVSPVSFWAL